MPIPAKKPRFRGSERSASPASGSARDRSAAERRRGADRRDPTRAGAYVGVERRSGPRRAADLPRPLWHRPIAVGLAVALGVAAGLAMGSTRRAAPVAAPSLEARADPELLAGVQAMRDEAEALTRASVELDEQAHELWMPRVTRIELALADPQTPEPIRTELDATLLALERVGVLGP
ncbi:MAG: hypothetical protein R6X02_32105 [Enhygromyxa sp.]